MIFPFMIYAQVVRGLNPTHAALLMAPQAVASIVIAPIAGKLVDRVHPRYLASAGLLGQAATIFWLSRVMTPDSATWQILLPALFLGISSSFVWGTLSTGANRNLPPQFGGLRIRRLQHGAPGGSCHRLCGDRGAHGVPDRRPPSGGAEVRRSPREQQSYCRSS